MNDSYASIAEKLAKRVSKWNDKLEGATDKISQSTAQRMLDRSMRRVNDLESAFVTDFKADAMEKMGGQATGQATGQLAKAAKGFLQDSPFGQDPIQAGIYGLSSILSLADNAKNKRTINSMQAPTQPLKYTAPRINTTMDVSSQVGSLANSVNGFRDNARKTFGSAASRSAALVKGMDAKAQGMNQIYSVKANQEGQLRNQQALMDMRTDSQNVATQNGYLDALTQFNNQKQGALSQNYAGAVTDLMLSAKDYSMARADKKRFDTMVPLWDKDGIYSAYYGGR